MAANGDGVATCFVCGMVLGGMNERQISDHVDECLTKSFLRQEAMARRSSSSSASATATTTTTTAAVDPPPTPPPMPPPPPQFGRGRQQLTRSDIELMEALARIQLEETGGGASPFRVECPYGGCGAAMEAAEFPQHAFLRHAAAPSQAVACPICALAGADFAAGSGTNLLRHLQSAHSEMLQVASAGPPRPPAPPAPVPMPPLTLGDGRTESCLRESIPGKECTICFEPFVAGQEIIVFECLCMYHARCIEKWVEKSGSTACPLHRPRGDDDDDDE